MSSKRYTEEFKIEAVKQVTDRGHSAPDVAKRLGVSQPTLYEWIKRYGVPEAERLEVQSQSAEIRKLKAELRRVTEERDILLADTPEAFAAAVLRLLDRPEEARAMGQRAGARVRAEQGWEVAADRFEVIARAVAERRAVPPAN